MKTAITVERLSKQYRIGGSGQETMLRERLANLAKRVFLRDKRREETIWALRDVSFSVQSGEIVGIVGRNGAGKSTLLKILSRITYPTSGSMKVGGRVASLLEVGTGFHEELTGRENIFLNGSILGMPGKEVEQKLEAIVEFSGVAKFIDTPIKRYSSGMRLRLGFAVAAHLDPDILIVDEVLAVGDAGFQKKCLKVMKDLRSGGRTVLFVSHNLAAVENLCSRCVWIDDGEVRMDGQSRQVIEAYMTAMAGSEAACGDLEGLENRRGSGEIRYCGIEFFSADGHLQKVTRAGEPVVMRLHYHARKSIQFPSFGLRVHTDMGTLVTDTSTWHHGIDIPVLEAGDGYLDLEIGCLNLLPGRYSLSFWLTGVDGIVYDAIEYGVTLEVELANIYGSGKVIDSRFGIVFFPQKWNLSGANVTITHLVGQSLAVGRG
jgi:lipopolysaccharide transport system ATP-binding protein